MKACQMSGLYHRSDGMSWLLTSERASRRVHRSRLLLVAANQSSVKGQKKRRYTASDGTSHLGSALQTLAQRPFPGPPPDEGHPLRVLPIGGLGEIGMNCMLVGVKGRYIVIDAGLMFPDFTDLGMQKILPDTSFLHQWRDKIEAVVITHGHEDHIGALPWVFPALDPSTPVYASDFVMQLVQRRMVEFSLWDEKRFHTFNMLEPFQAGPFEITPVRVTHSIPDCCGLIMRSDYGTIVHTGDWKIDEDPVDGQIFDRTTFDLLGKEQVALMMSDSTNVLSPGRTVSERVVEENIMRRVMSHNGKGRVILTQFASNIHRLAGVKKAADASGRKICFVGQSLTSYLEAAARVGKAPFDPAQIISPGELANINANEVLVVTTGSQAEPNAQLSMASRGASQYLQIQPSDLLLYSAKVIPGNDKKVTRLLNQLSSLGATVVAGASERLHTSGHAYQDELTEVLQFVKPQHFLPVHGEYTFLCNHAELARQRAGVQFTSVIKNGQMLGVGERRNARTLSTGSMAIIGSTPLVNYYHDGFKGTGTNTEMQLEQRAQLALEGIVIASLSIIRDSSQAGLRAQLRLTARGMWLDGGRLIERLEKEIHATISRMASTTSLRDIERGATGSLRKVCKAHNNRRPEVIVFVQESNPRFAYLPLSAPPPPGSSQDRQSQGYSRSHGPPPPRSRAPLNSWGEVPAKPTSAPSPYSSTPTPFVPPPPSTYSPQSPPPSPYYPPSPSYPTPPPPMNTSSIPYPYAPQATPMPSPAAPSAPPTAPPSPPPSSPSDLLAEVGSAARLAEAEVAAVKTTKTKGVVKKVVKRVVKKKAGVAVSEPQVLPAGVMEARRAKNPRDQPDSDTDVDFG